VTLRRARGDRAGAPGWRARKSRMRLPVQGFWAV